ncbi:hypothetical protein NDU88_000661 [Pleurodeles waltl]|uniref:Uncharacterized protein n=1 Tax=Pleurodeles waltl TaxID=8319 RepID=A0AAV7V7J7_PLEWA|nr:hypothetical protein NDU88_000661 [Pleurodeles waltl]
MLISPVSSPFLNSRREAEVQRKREQLFRDFAARVASKCCRVSGANVLSDSSEGSSRSHCDEDLPALVFPIMSSAQFHSQYLYS